MQTWNTGRQNPGVPKKDEQFHVLRVKATSLRITGPALLALDWAQLSCESDVGGLADGRRVVWSSAHVPSPVWRDLKV